LHTPPDRDTAGINHCVWGRTDPPPPQASARLAGARVARLAREDGIRGFVAYGRWVPHDLERDEAPPCGWATKFRQSNKSDTQSQAFIA